MFDALYTPRRARLLALALAALVAVVLVVTTRGGDDPLPHRLTVTLPQATNVIAGQKIRLAGTAVGEVRSITPVNGGRAARLELALGDRAWPVRRSTRMVLRWGGTVSFSNRYIALQPATDAAPPLADGGTFPARNFTVPMEFDALLRLFDRDARANLRRFLRSAGAAVGDARVPLNRALGAAPPALDEAHQVLDDLELQQREVSTVIRSGGQVLEAVNASQPDVRALLAGAGSTLDAVADEATALSRGLDIAPGTFANVRDTLRRADPTLVAVRRLTSRLAPGVRQLRTVSRPLDTVLGTLRSVGPDARRALATLRRSVPDVDPLLAKATDLSPRLRSIGAQAVDNLECIRPYTPEIAAFFTNWGGFLSNADQKDKVLRAQIQTLLPAPVNVMTYTSGEAKKAFPGMEFGFPRPPGTNAAQPWFLPQCGAGEDALDPSKDTEARPTGTPAESGLIDTRGKK